MSATDRVARIDNATAEQRYFAAQIVAAIEGCRAGNPTACA